MKIEKTLSLIVAAIFTVIVQAFVFPDSKNLFVVFVKLLICTAAIGYCSKYSLLQLPTHLRQFSRFIAGKCHIVTDSFLFWTCEIKPNKIGEMHKETEQFLRLLKLSDTEKYEQPAVRAWRRAEFELLLCLLFNFVFVALSVIQYSYDQSLSIAILSQFWMIFSVIIGFVLAEQIVEGTGIMSCINFFDFAVIIIPTVAFSLVGLSDVVQCRFCGKASCIAPETTWLLEKRFTLRSSLSYFSPKLSYLHLLIAIFFILVAICFMQFCLSLRKIRILVDKLPEQHVGSLHPAHIALCPICGGSGATRGCYCTACQGLGRVKLKKKHKKKHKDN